MSFVDNLEIQNVEDLKTFRDMVNAGTNFADKTIKLMADIDLNNEAWTPIGTGGKSFNGTFDGGNHTIKNLVVDGKGKSDQGFFGFTQNGEIKNLTFENAKVTGRLNVGVVAGTPYTSKYTNITVKGRVEVTGMAYVGGVGGKNAYADWTDITVEADDKSFVKADSIEGGKAYRTYVGGVIGFMGEGGHTFKNISSNIAVSGTVCDIGGIAGIGHYQNKFENVSCTGTVTNTTDDPENLGETGGILGVWHNQAGTTVSMKDCVFDGEVKDANGNDLGKDVAGDAYTLKNLTTGGSLLVANKNTDANGNETVQYSVTGGSEDSAKEALKNFIDAVEGAGSSAGYNIDSQKYNEETGSIDLITASSDEVLIGKGDETGYHEGQLVVDDGSTYVAEAIKFSQSSKNSAFRNGSALDVETLSIGNTFVATGLDENGTYKLSIGEQDKDGAIVPFAGQTYVSYFNTFADGDKYVYIILDENDNTVRTGNHTIVNAVLTVDYTSSLNFTTLNAAKETISIDMTGYDAEGADKTNRILNFKGTGMSLEEYEVVVKGDNFLTADRTDGAKFVEANGDLYVTDQDQSILYVNDEYNEETALEDNRIFSYNAFATVNDAMLVAQTLGGATIDLTDDGKPASYATVTDNAAIWRTNGTYKFINGNYADLATWVETARDSDTTDIDIIFENAKVIAGKFRLDTGATLTITNSHMDARNYISDNRAWTTFYGDAAINITNSVVGYHANGNGGASSDAIVAGDKTTDYSKHAAGMVFNGSGVMTVTNSTIFAYTNTANSVGALAVYDRGLMEFKNSAVYAHSFSVGCPYGNGSDDTIGRNGEVATMVLDNSVMRDINGDPQYELRIGSADRVGKLELRNGAELIHGAKMIVAHDSLVDINKSTLNLTSTVTNSGTVTATAKSTLNIGTLDNSKIVKIDDSTVTADKLNNNGLFNVTGESTLDIDAVTGAINLGATDKNTTVTFKDVKGGNLVLNDGSKEIWLKGNFDGGDDSTIKNSVNEYGSANGDAKGTTVYVAGDMNAQAVYVSQNSQVIVTDGGKLTALNDAGTEGNINVYGGTLTVKSSAATAVANVVGTVNVAGGSGRFEAGLIKIAQGTGKQISGVMNVTDNGTVYMKNGSIVVGVEDFGDKRYAVGTKPSAEAILSINKGTVELAVNDRDDRGLTVNAGGVVSVEYGALKIGTAEYSNNGYLENYGHVKMTNSTLEADIVKNNKVIDVYGESTLTIGSLSGDGADKGRIVLNNGTVLKDSTITHVGAYDPIGTVAAYGTVKLVGTNNLIDGILIAREDAQVTITGKLNAAALSTDIRNEAETKEAAGNKITIAGDATVTLGVKDAGVNVRNYGDIWIRKQTELVVDGTLYHAGQVSNRGTITVNKTGSVTFAGRYDNGAGAIGIGTSSAAGKFVIDGGKIKDEKGLITANNTYGFNKFVVAKDSAISLFNGAEWTTTDSVMELAEGASLTVTGSSFTMTKADKATIPGGYEITATLKNSGKIEISKSEVKVDVLDNTDGTINMSWDSNLTMDEFDGNAITVNADGFAANTLDKVIDMTGTDAIADTEYSISNGTDVKGILYKGDLYLSTVDTSTIYLNATYADSDDAFGTKYADGIYGGVNAFDTFSEALKAGSKINISGDGVISERKEVTIGKSKTVELSGKGTVKTSKVTLEGTLNVATGADITFDRSNAYDYSINMGGAMNIAKDAKVRVNYFLVKGKANVNGGTLTVDSALYLKGKNAVLTATNGATVEITKVAEIGYQETGSAVVIDGSTLTAKNGKFTVKAGSSLTVKGASTINVTNAAVAGTINVVGATLSSSKLTGSATDDRDGKDVLIFDGSNTLSGGSEISLSGADAIIKVGGTLALTEKSTLSVEDIIMLNKAEYTGATSDITGTVLIHDNDNILATLEDIEIVDGKFTLENVVDSNGKTLAAGTYKFTLFDAETDKKITDGKIDFVAGSLTVALDSMAEYTGTIWGTITVDAEGAVANEFYKVVNYNGSATADVTKDQFKVTNGNADKLFAVNGDFFYGDVAKAYFYVNGTWTAEAGDIVDGYIYGENASTGFNDNADNNYDYNAYRVIGNTTVDSYTGGKAVEIVGSKLTVGTLKADVTMDTKSQIKWDGDLAGSAITIDLSEYTVGEVMLFDYQGTGSVTLDTYHDIITNDWNNAFYIKDDGDLWFDLSKATSSQALGGMVNTIDVSGVTKVTEDSDNYVGGKDITVTGMVAGGQVVNAVEGWYYRTGDIDTTINGGTFKNYVFGGMFKNNGSALNVITLKGDINTTINGGTFKNYVYGGHGLRKVDVASITQKGDINLTIDSSKYEIVFEKTLVAGSHGTCVLDGDINVTIKGSKDITMGQFWGSNAGGYYREPVTDNAEMDYHNVTGSRNLTFDKFSGNFSSGAIVGFQNVKISDSTVNFNGVGAMYETTGWEMDWDSEITNFNNHNFAGDKLAIDLTGWDQSEDQSEQTLISGASVDSLLNQDVILTIGGVNATLEGDVWKAGNYQFEIDTKNDKAILSKVALA